jgi:hypothetical protein
MPTAVCNATVKEIHNFTGRQMSMKLARSLKEKQVNAFRRFAAGQTASPEGIAEVYQSQAPPTSSQSGQNSRPVSALRPEKSAEIFVFHCDATNAAMALFSAMLKVHPFCLAVFRRDRRASSQTHLIALGTDSVLRSKSGYAASNGWA